MNVNNSPSCSACKEDACSTTVNPECNAFHSGSQEVPNGLKEHQVEMFDRRVIDWHGSHVKFAVSAGIPRTVLTKFRQGEAVNPTDYQRILCTFLGPSLKARRGHAVDAGRAGSGYIGAAI